MKFVYLFLFCILYTLPWSSDCSPAHYSGRHAGDAGKILNQSQGKKPFGFNNPGHPKHHASARHGPSVEKYSSETGKQKSGFDSRHMQNEAAHAFLSHPRTQRAMQKLNRYNSNNPNPHHKKQVVTLSKQELQMQHLTGGLFNNGRKTSSFPIGGATMVLLHRDGQQGNHHAPVHVQTFYPH